MARWHNIPNPQVVFRIFCDGKTGDEHAELVVAEVTSDGDDDWFVRTRENPITIGHRNDNRPFSEAEAMSEWERVSYMAHVLAGELHSTLRIPCGLCSMNVQRREKDLIDQVKRAVAAGYDHVYLRMLA